MESEKLAPAGLTAEIFKMHFVHHCQHVIATEVLRAE